jgi:hypothetical protein
MKRILRPVDLYDSLDYVAGSIVGRPSGDRRSAAPDAAG